MRECLSAVAGILMVAGFIPYIRAILRGETKPAKASWIIWATLDTITMAGMYAVQTLNGQIIGAIAGAWIIVALALKYGTPGWTRLDKFCLTGAALALVLWRAFHDPVFGIVTSAIVLVLGSIPTFVSAWKDPRREDKTAWTLYWLSCVCVILAIPQWTLADAVQPFSFFAVESTMMLILFVLPQWRAEETPHMRSGSPQTERRRR